MTYIYIYIYKQYIINLLIKVVALIGLKLLRLKGLELDKCNNFMFFSLIGFDSIKSALLLSFILLLLLLMMILLVFFDDRALSDLDKTLFGIRETIKFSKLLTSSDITSID